VQAVVFAALELGWYGRRLVGADVPAGTSVTLVDRNGVILAREPEGEQWVGRAAPAAPIVRTIAGEPREGTGVMEDLDGVQKLVAFAPVLGLPTGISGHVAVGIPLEVAFADTDRAFAQNVWALGVAGVAIVLLTWVSAEPLLLRRIRAMVGMAQRLSVGDVSARSGVATGSGELAELAKAFDTMAAELERRQAETERAEEALRRANDELEKRVQERTAHLVAANEAQQVALRDLKRAQDHLDEQQTQLAAIIESATEAIITVDEDQCILVFNRAAERIFRLPAAEALGRSVERFIPERFRVQHYAGFRLLDRSGVPANPVAVGGSAVALRADGEEFPIEAAVSMVEIRGEKLYTVILHDISDRLKTEDTLRKLSLAVEQTTESVFITNRGGIIEYVNPAFEHLTGYRRPEVIGRKPSILKSGEHDAAFYDKVWRTILAGQVYSGVFLNRKKSGELYYEERSITPIRGDGQTIMYFVAAGRDVTQRKRAEEALRRLNTRLEQEAERIAHTLHDEAGQLLTSVHITLADVARDLPPLAQERVGEFRTHLDSIEANLRRLSHELRPRILDDLGLGAAVEFLADGVMKRTGIVVTTEVVAEERLPAVTETTLYRFIQEALTNAAKHARPTRINVVVARDSSTVRCAVRDDGAGFDVAEVLARRGETSLGLVGLRDRVEALGGTLEIASDPGKGTELHALIPLGNGEI
jgi:PAS domain S-box-containing protein